MCQHHSTTKTYIISILWHSFAFTEKTDRLLGRLLDAPFVRTKTFEKCVQSLEKHKHILITGKHGEGKSVFCAHLMKEFQENSVYLTEPQNWNDVDWITTSLVVFDDMFGRCWLEEHLYHEWGKIFERTFEDKVRDRMVIVTVSDDILKSLKARGKDIPFRSFFQHISLNSTDLSEDEKTDIADSYSIRNSYDRATIKDANLYLFGYPLLCSIVSSQQQEQSLNILNDNDHLVSSLVYRLLGQSPDEYCRLCTSALVPSSRKNDRNSINTCVRNIPRIRRLREKTHTREMTLFPACMYAYKNVSAVFQKYVLVSFSKLAPQEFIDLADVECLMTCVGEDMSRIENSPFISLPKEFTPSLVARIVPAIADDTILRRTFVHSSLAKSEHVLMVLFQHLQDEDQFCSVISIDEPEASLLVCYAKYCQSSLHKLLQRLEILDINPKRLEVFGKQFLENCFQTVTSLKDALLDHANKNDTRLSTIIKSYFDNMSTNEEESVNSKVISSGNIIKNHFSISMISFHYTSKQY